MNIGYIRISSKDQNPQRQIEPIQNLTERQYIDTQSGKDTNRPQLQEMLLFARKGDLIIVESISRFARNTKDLLELIEQLNQKEIGFKSLKENIDTTTPQGKFMVTVFGAMAELERDYIKQRQREGIDIALRDKRAYGRPKSLSDEEIAAAYQEYKNSNYTKGIYERLGVSKATFYRLMKEWEKKSGN
jgi:DNA invertase Pin-like site-specific DNA recombinase